MSPMTNKVIMFRVSEILKATKGGLLAGSEPAQIKGVSIDSRSIRKGEIFVAIKGARYDGHTFVADALKKGAVGAIVCSKKVLSSDIMKFIAASNCFIILVDDSLKALGEIASFHRRKFDIPVVAVTGSNGKTATKEMIENILRSKWSPLKNTGTQNNLVGVPLTLLKLTDRNKSAIIELGMSRAGEIKELAEMVRPNIGVITNIGPSHLEYLESLEAIYRAKRELLDFLGKWDIAVLNNDDLFLRRFKKKGLKILTFSIKRKSDFQARDIKRQKQGWRFKIRGRPYFIPLAAYHDIYNALAAISIGMLCNVNFEEMARALNNCAPLEKRMRRSVFNDIEFIDDTYNSNPLSLKNAIKTLADYRTRGKKILVSGDMLELGKKSVYYHKRVGRLVARSGIDNFITVGDLMHNSFLAAKRYGMKNTHSFSTKEEAAALLKRIARPDDVILVKGSRATQMEDVIKCFITSFTH